MPTPFSALDVLPPAFDGDCADRFLVPIGRVHHVFLFGDSLHNLIQLPFLAIEISWLSHNFHVCSPHWPRCVTCGNALVCKRTLLSFFVYDIKQRGLPTLLAALSLLRRKQEGATRRAGKRSRVGYRLSQINRKRSGQLAANDRDRIFDKERPPKQTRGAAKAVGKSIF